MLFELVNQSEKYSHSIPIYNLGQWQVKSNSCSASVDLLATQIKTFSKSKPFGVVVTTPEEVMVAKSIASYLYIPGEMCRQADVLTAAKNSSCTILLERGAFLSPQDLLLALPKLEGREILLVDAGTFMGYSDRVLDPRVLSLLKTSGHKFGINLSALLNKSSYEHAPSWIKNDDFIPALMSTAKALGATFLVVDENINEVHLKNWNQ